MYLILAEIVIWIVVAVGIRKLLKLNRALTVLAEGDSLSEHKLSIADLLIGENEVRDMSLPQAVELGRVNRVIVIFLLSLTAAAGIWIAAIQLGIIKEHDGHTEFPSLENIQP